MKKDQEELKQLLIRMPRKLWKYLKTQSCKDEISMNSIMVDWLQQAMAKKIHKKKQLAENEAKKLAASKQE